MSINQAGPTSDEKLEGGGFFRVHFEDGSEEDVKVREIKVGEFRTASKVWGDEFATVAAFCDKPTAWVEKLTPDSYETLVTEGNRINQRFFNYCARTEAQAIQRARILAPASLERLEKQAMAGVVVEAKPSLSGLRTPLPTPESP